jgi:hypothetical protein
MMHPKNALQIWLSTRKAITCHSLALSWRTGLVILLLGANAVAMDASEEPKPEDSLADVLVLGAVPTPSQLALHQVVQAAYVLKDIPLHYTFTRRFGREILRGRPVVFAAWSEREKSWSVVEIEVPFPAPKWAPGGKSIAFRVLTPGYEAEHVRGVGTERLMFNIFRGDERLRVYGRKYPMIDAPIVKKRGARFATEIAEVIQYLPQTDDVTPLFTPDGRTLLTSTAEAALMDLRERKVPSFAFPDKLLADTVLPQTLVSLAVIEQTDDHDFAIAPLVAINNTLGQYGVMQTRAFTYSVSRANAIGPMQFTNRRGKGTYSWIAKKCVGADLDPDFDLGARDLRNAMKAAACLLDFELAQMPNEIQDEYAVNPAAVSIFQVAAYNGGQGNARRLMKAIRKLKAEIADLRLPDAVDFKSLTTRCPCLWLNRQGQSTAVTIPTYNRENMGYVDKYQRVVRMMQDLLSPEK